MAAANRASRRVPWARTISGPVGGRSALTGDALAPDFPLATESFSHSPADGSGDDAVGSASPVPHQAQPCRTPGVSTATDGNSITTLPHEQLRDRERVVVVFGEDRDREPRIRVVPPVDQRLMPETQRAGDVTVLERLRATHVDDDVVAHGRGKIVDLDPTPPEQRMHGDQSTEPTTIDP